MQHLNSEGHSWQLLDNEQSSGGKEKKRKKKKAKHQKLFYIKKQAVQGKLVTF